MRFGAWLGRGGVHPYVAGSVRTKGGSGLILAWLVAIVIGVIGALIWTIL